MAATSNASFISSWPTIAENGNSGRGAAFLPAVGEDLEAGLEADLDEDPEDFRRPVPVPAAADSF
ncbi:MAG: hypothetical protein PsegKO_10300 [Pseudohongiellaceae bacterium]